MIEIDLRRSDFEAMHSKAKLFGFDEDKKLYTGDGVESINDQWTTWCACIAMLYLESQEQAVPDGFVVVPEEPTGRMLDSAYSSISDNLHYADLENIYRAMIWSAQEPAND